jgi:predicted hydrocarbon binding protein
MNQIKLRAWDEENKKMIYNIGENIGDTLYTYLLSQNEDNTICIIKEGSGEQLPTMLSSNNYDKNGTEIWAEDIIQFKRLKRWGFHCAGGEYNDEEIETFIGIVKFEDGAFKITNSCCYPSIRNFKNRYNI